MQWLRNNKGSLIVTSTALIVGILLFIFLLSFDFDAEAVIGGVGNLSDAANPHNLSSTSTGVRAVSERQICIFCHTPHRAISNAALIDGPLWNHKLSEATYIVNSAGQMFYNGTIGNIVLMTSPPDKPDGTSRMCLSCHDGTVGIGAVQSRSSDIEMESHTCIDAGGRLVSGAGCAYIGIDLTKKHVVSIPMNQQLIDNSAARCSDTADVSTKLKYPWTALGGGSNANVILRPTATQYLGNPGIEGSNVRASSGCASDPACFNKYKDSYYYGVQCSVCHDPHFWVNTSNNQVPGYKFIVDNFNSLCKACHMNCN